MLAPIAATAPAAAQSDDGGSIEVKENCGSMTRFVAPRACQTAEDVFGSVDTSQDAAAIEQDIHVGATGIKSSQDASNRLYKNYLQDTGTIASMEARNAIATAYQNNEDPAVADANAQAAINDYYARLQISLLEESAVHAEQIAYYANVSQTESGINNGFVHIFSSWGTSRPAADTGNVSVSVANGSTHTVAVPKIKFNDANNNAETITPNYFEKSYANETKGTYEQYLEGYTSDDADRREWRPTFHLLNTGSLESKTIYDYRVFRDRFEELEQQSDTVVSNYESGTAQEFYTAMDNGEIEPNELRGAEGMVRHLSGDANVTDERYQYALRSVLDMNRTSLDSTMVVDFEGATHENRVVNDSTGEVTYEYNSVNATYEGLLYSAETPAGGFQTGETYDVSNLNGTQRMVTGKDGGNASDVTFYRGNMTITKMTDGDGNEVNQTSLTDRPDYGTFDATEYQETIQKADAERDAITTTYGDSNGGGAGIGWPNLGGDSASQQTAAALVVAIVIVAILAGLVTDVFDSLGP
ncbi:hypothetical protein [Natrinema amylolyticum]|uniref:hypothetical protein n=1 Tax=Natrinema amylolyticum TaxID=2878679 RepID=UPI001CFA933F|nr:hypothetical protein [Natrinema amylolyticum]